MLANIGLEVHHSVVLLLGGQTVLAAWFLGFDVIISI